MSAICCGLSAEVKCTLAICNLPSRSSNKSSESFVLQDHPKSAMLFEPNGPMSGRIIT